MEHDSEPNIYCVNIWIRAIHPMLWRRFLVRSDSTLADHHVVLQINSAGQIRLWTPGESLQRFMNMLGSCWPTGILKRCFSCFYGRFKRLGSAYDDLAVHKLPTDTLCRKEIVDGLLERRCFRLPERLVIARF